MKRWLDSAVMILGCFSFMSLVGFFLALHDIWHDFASPEVWSRAGQSLPQWYDPVNQCPLEWRMLQVGFLLILAFHILLFVRLLVRNYGKPSVS
jgi:succinate dehydrogenase/fumarate reductase cytochrome b subunit